MGYRKFLGLVVVAAGISGAALYVKTLQAEPQAVNAAGQVPQAGPVASELKLSADALKALPSKEEQYSYAMGFDLGGSMKSLPTKIDEEQFVSGLKSALSGDKGLLSNEEVQGLKMEFIKKAQADKMASMKAEGEKNLKIGKDYLAANKTKEGVVETASGLQYKVITAGTGAKPAATDTVKVHYRGTTLDGTEFDSSYKRNAPAQFALNQVIPGWTEGLQLMPVGSKYEFTIPSPLAYGDRGHGPQIPPSSTLKFEVELLEIVPKAGDQAK